MEILQLILVGCVLIFLLYKYGSRNNNYWLKKGVKQKNPLPFIGNNTNVFTKRFSGLEDVCNMYNQFKGERVSGLYLFQYPFLQVRDPELLKQIMVKDAEYFVNRHNWSITSDPLMSKNLSALRDDKWRSLRLVMTTVFTTAKMKEMFWFVTKCATQAVEHAEALLAEKKNSKFPGGDVVEMDFKNFFCRYGTDVIASTAFGYEVDSFKHPENEFYTAGETVRNLAKGSFVFKLFFMTLCPTIAQRLNMTFLGQKCNNFLISIIKETIREREENKIVRKDVIHILMEARKGKEINGELEKGKLPDLTDLDIAAQATIFFFAGFEIVATLLGFISYELAANPDVQEKLQKEIDEVIERENGVTYDGIIHQMKYLDLIVNETLRKWPPALLTDREVTKTYIIPKTDKSPEVVLHKGSKIWIPIAGLHRDPEYFPNPEKFDPERFRDEKNTIKPFTFLPFGEGIRHCIGMRFALMEAKAILVHMLKKFTIVPSENTVIPIKLLKNGAFLMSPEKGFLYGLKLRH